ncbi:MAG TPA: hypothetical protein VGG39_37070 [Polyangiaceae bacterium]|jgi:hypothetical protein
MNAVIRRCPVLVVATFVSLATLVGCARPESSHAAAHPIVDYAVSLDATPRPAWQPRYEAHTAALPVRAWGGALAKR